VRACVRACVCTCARVCTCVCVYVSGSPSHRLLEHRGQWQCSTARTAIRTAVCLQIIKFTIRRKLSTDVYKSRFTDGNYYHLCVCFTGNIWGHCWYLCRVCGVLTATVCLTAQRECDRCRATVRTLCTCT
jgi:hypothetical protein